MGAPLACSIADVLNTNAPRAYFMMERHGVDSPVWDDIFAEGIGEDGGLGSVMGRILRSISVARKRR